MGFFGIGVVGIGILGNGEMGIVDTDSSDGLLIRFDKPIDKPTDPIWSLNIIPYAYNLKFVKKSF